MSKLETFVAKAKTQNDTIRAVARELNTLMDSMGVNSLNVAGVRLRLDTKRASVGSSCDLEMRVDGDAYEPDTWVCLEVAACAERSTGHHWGDFNARYTRPAREDLLRFARAVPAILDELLGSVDKAQDVVDTADMVMAAK